MSVLDRAMMRFITVHDAVYQRSHGWVGHWIPFSPRMLLLHSIGAKTAARRTHSLAYFRDGDEFLIVASNGGAQRNPAWYHNLRAHPEVEINVGRRRVPVRAVPVLPDDPDYARLWKICDEQNFGRYGAYQTLTTRPIPVVRLVPSPH